MNLDNLEIRPNVNTIYSLIGQERLMEFYFGDRVKLGKKYCNPFRNDTNAGCSFKWSQGGNLYFLDYATEQVFFTPLDIAQMRTGYHYPDILYKIESDFQIKDLDLADRNRLVLESSVRNGAPPELKPADIKVKLTKFSAADLAYWAQFGITESILKFYDVRRVQKAWIADQLWYLDNPFDPCYRYKEKEKFKLYRPKAEKQHKFRSNYFGGLLEGYTQLPHKGEILVITKGLKDVMTLHSIGVNAVAVRSENTPMSENAFELLKNRFDKIYIWFDVDEAGFKGAAKMSNLYNLPTLTHDKELGKDPSDIYRDHGKEKLTEICHRLKIL